MEEQETAENAETYNHPLSGRVIGHAIEVHRQLGPGLLESTYKQCLAHELHQARLKCKIEVTVPVYYKGIALNCGYRIDLFVEDQLVLELKAVEQLTGLHQAQLLTYMRLADAPLGLLINFNVKMLKDGIKKCSLTHPPRLPVFFSK